MTVFAKARDAMVWSQVHPRGVTDRRILKAMAELPRERFVPPAKQSFAYIEGDIEVWPPLGDAPARFLLAPAVLAQLIQLAMVEAESRVLDIGCATGYSAAVLSQLARQVVAVEAEPELAAAARANLSALGMGNVEVIEAELTAGAPALAPFDVVLLNGSVPELPEELGRQLAEEGRLVAVIAKPQAPQGKAFLFVNSEGVVTGQARFDANADPLPGFSPPPGFSF